MSNGGSGASLLIFLLPVALIAFMVWSQRRRQREVQNLQSGLSVGERVCTTSGLYGTITAIEDRVVILEVAPGVQLRFDRRAIGSRTVPDASSTQDASDLQDANGIAADETSGSSAPTDPGTSK